MIEKLLMSSKDMNQENIKKIQQIFPNVVTEILVDGKIKLKIDYDLLKQELSSDIIEDNKERYQFSWPDKKHANINANSKINKTLNNNVE